VTRESKKQSTLLGRIAKRSERVKGDQRGEAGGGSRRCIHGGEEDEAGRSGDFVVVQIWTHWNSAGQVGVKRRCRC
jgi:hypothetical protein